MEEGEHFMATDTFNTTHITGAQDYRYTHGTTADASTSRANTEAKVIHKVGYKFINIFFVFVQYFFPEISNIHTKMIRSHTSLLFHTVTFHLIDWVCIRLTQS